MDSSTSNRLIIAGVLIFILLSVMYMSSSKSKTMLAEDLGQYQSRRFRLTHPLSGPRWTDKELKPLPQYLQDARESSYLHHTEGFINVFGNAHVFCREVRSDKAGSARGSVLFLHGANYTSQRWEEMGTLHLVANMGFRAVAVDLPGKI